jgi:hypothetical protein
MVQTYFWLAFCLLGFAPIAVVYSAAAAVPQALRIASIAWPAVVVALFSYGAHRCSTDKMSFHDGLLWITRSMITGWMVMSFFTVTPALLTAFLGSIGIALYGDLRRQPRFAPAKWSQVVSFFYRNRMRR